MPVEILQGTLVLPDRIVPAGQVLVEDGRVREIASDGPRHEATHDYGNSYILPGLIDLHVHGIAGTDIMDGSVESVDHIAQRFAARGVTGFLATTVTQSLDVTLRAIASIQEWVETPRGGRAQVLGIHLEGPFLNPAFKGMQNEAYLLPPDVNTMRELLTAARGHITRVSLAPELPGADELIQLLREAGVYVSIAHTAASYDEAIAALELGATHVTHCFNAMTGLHHRRPGVAGATLEREELYAELVADGIHVHPAVMRVLIRTKGRRRVMLVTDAMSAAEMPDGLYEFGGHAVTVHDGVARMKDGTLASSTLTMDAGLRNLVQMCRVTLVDAVHMASTTPAEAMGFANRKGKLAAGYDADLAVFDEALQPVATWVAGQVSFAS